MSYQVLNPDPSDSYATLLQLIDNHLTIAGTSANPNADVDSAVAGIFYYNTNTEALWVCTNAGTAGVDVVWKRLYFSINPASYTEAGIVKLATASEVSAGVNDTKAITPASMGATFSKVADHDADVATLQSQIDTHNTKINAVEATLNSATSEATASTLVKRDANGNLKVATPSNPAHAVTRNYVDTADAGLQSQITNNTNDLAAATSAATANKLARRDNNANISVGNATAASHAVRKDIVDALQTTVTNLSTTVGTNTTNISTLQGEMSTAQSDILTNASGILTNAGDITNLQADLAKAVGGASSQSLTLDGSGNGVPTSALLSILPNTGTSGNLNRLIPTNAIPVIVVYNKVPATNTITLKHQASSANGYLKNADAGDINLVTAGQAVIYALDNDGSYYFYNEIGRLGFSTSDSVSMLKAKNITESLETLPTSGNWDKPVYIHYGNWTSTGNITITVPIVKIYLKGNFTLNHTITQSSTAVSNGGLAMSTGYGTLGAGNDGGGYNGSGGRRPLSSGYNNTNGGSGGGGGNGGNGGSGGYAYVTGAPGQKGVAIPFLALVPGGGGASGSCSTTYAGGAGGQGGAALYLEVNGNISFGGNVTLDGAAGSITAGDDYNGGGGGGGGGTFISLCTGTWTLSGGVTLSTKGGNGGSGRTNGVGGGGGGGGRQYHRSIGTLTNNGTLSVSGGTKGAANGTVSPTDGSAGVSSAVGSVSAVYSLF